MNVRELESILQHRGKPRVLIVGDLILDAYVSGRRGAHLARGADPGAGCAAQGRAPGGAGNVAANLVAMGAAVDVVGVLGDDGYGRALRQLMEEQGIDTGGCAMDATRRRSSRRA
ncbi:MAG: PfkB family carbohydrate kinase [Candidatus Binatia bacterium]